MFTTGKFYDKTEKEWAQGFFFFHQKYVLKTTTHTFVYKHKKWENSYCKGDMYEYLCLGWKRTEKKENM